MKTLPLGAAAQQVSALRPGAMNYGTKAGERVERLDRAGAAAAA